MERGHTGKRAGWEAASSSLANPAQFDKVARARTGSARQLRNDPIGGRAPSGATDHAFPESVPIDHFAKLSDLKRLRSLKAMGLLDTISDPALDRTTRLATRIMGVPVSLFSLVDDGRQVFACAVGLEDGGEAMRETPLTHSFCQYVVTAGRALEVEDARMHPLLMSNGAIRDLSVIAYLGHPVRAPDGSVVGSFCAISDRPRKWDEEDRLAIADLAAMLEGELHLRQEMRRNKLLSQELDHRLQNLFTVAIGLLRISTREISADPQASGTAEELRTLLSARLTALASAQALAMESRFNAEREGMALGALVASVLQPYLPDPTKIIAPAVPPVRLTATAVTYLALALHELATNALKYGGLSEEGQGLSVGWHFGPDGGLLIEWCEDVVHVADAETPGFGSTLLSNAITGGLGGSLERTNGAKTRRIVIRIPGTVLAG
jgi:two-component sensor histidine kinase